MRKLLVSCMLMLFMTCVSYAEVEVRNGRASGGDSLSWTNLTENVQSEEKKDKTDVGVTVDVNAECNVTNDLYTGVKSDGDNTDIIIFKKCKF